MPTNPTNRPASSTPLTQLTAANLTGSKLDAANMAELFLSCGQRVNPSDLQEVLFTPGHFAIGVYHCRTLVGAAIYQLDGRQVYLLDIVVRRDVRRQGIGRKLLDTIAARVIGHNRLDLIVSLPTPGGALARFLIACKFRPAGALATGKRKDEMRFFFRRSVADDVIHSIWFGDGRVVN